MPISNKQSKLKIIGGIGFFSCLFLTTIYVTFFGGDKQIAYSGISFATVFGILIAIGLLNEM